MSTVLKLVAITDSPLQPTNIACLPLKDYYDINNAVRLGSGGYGVVHKYKLQSGKKPKKGRPSVIAIKEVDATRMNENQFRAEWQVARKVSHPNVVTFLAVQPKSEVSTTMQIIMECCKGDLYKLVNHGPQLRDADVVFLAKQILTGLHYLHSEASLAHCDLKPANILVQTEDDIESWSKIDISKVTLKLSDFGSAKIVPKEEHLKRALTPPVTTADFAAPEIKKAWRNQLEVSNCDYQLADVYSFGLLVFYLRNQRLPTEKEVSDLQSGNYSSKFPLFTHFFSICLKINPKYRCDTASLINHPLFDKKSLLGSALLSTEVEERLLTFIKPGVSKEEPLRVLLIGKTGSGKSSTGNSILNLEKSDPNAFVANANMNGQTQKSELKLRANLGVNWSVVDTPGVLDRKIPANVVMSEIMKSCIDMMIPGPNAILLVIETGRFTKEDEKSVQHFVDYFGPELYKYTIVLFTGKEKITHDGDTLQSWLDRQEEGPLMNIVNLVDRRVVAFNNLEKDHEERDKQVEELLRMITEMKHQNQVSYYSDDNIRFAEEEREKRRLADEKEQRRQQKLRDAKQNKELTLKLLFGYSVEARLETVRVLNKIAADFDMCLQGSRRKKIAGAAAGIIGSSLSIAGGAVIVATAGAAALPVALIGSLMWTGFGVGCAGGVISGHTRLSSALKERQMKESIALALVEDERKNSQLRALTADFEGKKFVISWQGENDKPILVEVEEDIHEVGLDLRELLEAALPDICTFDMEDENLNKVLNELKKLRDVAAMPVKESVKGVGGAALGIGGTFGDDVARMMGRAAAGGIAIGLGMLFAALDVYSICKEAYKKSFGEPLRKIAEVFESKLLNRPQQNGDEE